MKIQLKHSNVLDSGLAKQPTAVNMLDGEIAVNFNASDPAIFIKNSDGNIVRIAGKDNLAFTGYEASIQAASTPPTGLEAGNLYFDTDDNRLYYYYNDGTTTQWVDASTEKFDVTIIPDPTNLSHQSGTLDDRYVNSNGDTMSGNLVLNAGVNINSSDIYLNNGKITFEGASANAHEIRLTVIEPTADRTLSLPDTTGTIVSTGDTGTVTSSMIADGTIQNTDVSNSAAIDLSKLATGSLPSGITVASANIANGTIVDEDISSSASITLSKLGSGALPSGVTITSSSIAGGVSPTDIAAGALPNNVTIATSNITNGTIVDEDVSSSAKIQVSKLADGSSRQLLQVDVAGTNVEWTSDVDIPGTLDVAGNSTFDGNATVSGNLIVDGSTVALNANIVTVKDTNIQLGVISSPTDVSADGGGITLKGSTDKTFNWLNSSDSWTSSENLDLASGKAYYINGAEVLNQTALASGVTGSSLTSLGTISSGTWQGNQITDAYLAAISTAGKVANTATTATNLNSANAIVARDGSGDFIARNITASLIGNADSADKLSTARTISLTGDLTGSASFDGTSNISINTSAIFTGTTNLSYITGTRTITSDTGTNAILPLFSNTDAGLTGASGGGTVNYLRADGTWASPPGTATNLGYVLGTSTITSSTGTGVALPLFSSSNSGLVQGSGGGTTKFLRADGSWIDLGSSRTSLGVSPPSNAAPGDAWFDTDEGRTYIYYQDTDSTQWVEANPSWNGGIPVGSVTPNYLSIGGPNWDASGNLTAAGSITAASGVITGSLTQGGSNVLTAGDTGTVTTTILADDSVTQAKIDDGSISASKLAADSVTTTKIVNGAITSAKLATEAVATTNITDASVTTAKIADNAITSAKIVDGTIVNADVNANAAIAGTKISPDFGSQNVLTTGRVGIGTSAPAGLFHIEKDIATAYDSTSDNGQSSDTATCLIANQNGTTNSFSQIVFDTAGNNQSIARIAAIRTGTSSNDMAFVVEGGNTKREAMRITSSGNVGIGTSSPVYQLDVGGSARIGAPTGNASLEIGTGATENRYAYIDLVGDTTYTDYAFRIFRDATGPNAASALEHRGTGSLLITAKDSAPIVLETSNTERMRIDSGGNVGIGTSAPSSLFTTQTSQATAYSATASDGQVGSSATLLVRNIANTNNAFAQLVFSQRSTNALCRIAAVGGSSPQLAFTTNNAERLRIDENGYVGIGTTSPDEALSIAKGSASTIRLGTAGGNYAYRLRANVSSTVNGGFYIEDAVTGNDLYRVKSGSDGIHQFFIDSSEKMRLDAGGSLAIGTTTPTARLTQVGGRFHNNRPSDFWSSTDYIDVSGYGSLSTQGSFEVDLQCNGYRNSDSSTWTRLNVNGQVGAAKISLNPAGLIKFCTDSNKANGSSAGVTERMRITQGGSLLIHQVSSTVPGAGNSVVGAAFEKSSSGSALFVSRSDNTVGYFNRNSNGSLLRFYRSGTQEGSIEITTTGVSLSSISDYRLKENVTDLSNGIDRLKLLTPRRFNFIAEPDQTIDGFIAHEISDAIPEAVFGEKDAMEDQEVEVTPAVLDEDGNVTTEAVMETKSVISPQGIDQSKLVPLLTAALQEAIAKIETLEQRLSDAGIA